MTAYVLYQLEWILRLFVAAICGGLVGYERKVRLKTAGIRTHMLVAVGLALFMIISKYGFFDVINHADVSLDPSRIASQVVTGIGFIGAGAIITRNHKIDGLTTAADYGQRLPLAWQLGPICTSLESLERSAS